MLIQDVLDAICASQKWDPQDVRVSELDMKSMRFASLRRYEVSVGLEKSEFVFKLSDDEVLKWRRLRKSGSSSGWEFERLVNEVSSNAVLDVVKIEGPFELRVGGDDDEIHLMLPVFFVLWILFCGLRFDC